ncbi:MAG: hypothetical protein N2558_03695 [Patescibacteria group bacterium]|nr:hypothetical protein [Patescibacteria group bacterium]
MSILVFKNLAFLIVFCFLFFVFIYLVSASGCSNLDYDCRIAEIQKEIDALSSANENNKKELSTLKNQIVSLSKKIKDLTLELEIKENEIFKRQEDLNYTKIVFEEKTKNHYKFIRLYNPVLPFIYSDDANLFFQEISIQQKVASFDVESIQQHAQKLIKLRNDKEKLEQNKKNLAQVKKQIDERASFLANEVEKTEKYLSVLSQKQQELLALKAGGFSTSIGDVPPTAEPCSGSLGTSTFCDPGFRPAFAAFSFGAPHRVGMSQYGAYGRSLSGQSAETILAAYYQGTELNKNYPVPSTIGVIGVGRIPFEENYLLGIHEVPESWGDNGGFEALKAQAVAARTYALAVTNNGTGSICTTEKCQVYKPQLKTGKWAEAVRHTRGWVLTKGGVPAKTYYSASAGGYTISQWGWIGIKDASSDWPSTAYEKIAGSPWFYKAWYKDRSGKSCGRSHPWLTSEQMADILNAWHVIYKGNGDISRISPIDKSCWTGNPYSVSELFDLGGYSAVSAVSVIYGSDGSTLSVSFTTNKGFVNIPADEFKRAFNLRAPGYIGIKSSLYNIEKL